MTEAEKLVGVPFKVLDHGEIVLMDYMGGDEAITQSARTSYQKGTKQVSDDRGLIRYLFRHQHATPFESVAIKIYVKLPIFVERQWARHRTAGWNEVSARYSVLPEETYLPDIDAIRQQSKTNKQGRDEPVEVAVAEKLQLYCQEQAKIAFERYQELLDLGVARELARVILPLSTYTTKVWWCNLRNIFNFLRLRMDSHAQWEIRQYAEILGREIVAKVCPLAWEAFVDYQLEQVQLSKEDKDVFARLGAAKASLPLTKESLIPHLPKEWQNQDVKVREREEFLQKLVNMGIITLVQP